MRIIIFTFLLLPFSVIAKGFDINLRDITLHELVHLAYTEIIQRPYVLAPDLIQDQRTATLYLQNATADAVSFQLSQVLTSSGYSVEIINGVAFISKRKTDEEPREAVIYLPVHRSATYLSDMATMLLNVSHAKHSLPKKSANSETPEHDSKPVESTQQATQNDQLVFYVPVKQANALRQLLPQLDTPTSEILLKAAVYEVASTNQTGNAISLALNVAGIQIGSGAVTGSGDFIKLTKGGLDVVLSALDADSRFKSLSKPHVRVRNGGEAKLIVGQEVPILGNNQLDRNGNSVQNVEYKPSGIILRAKPEIRQNTIEIDLAQELSHFVPTTSGVNNSPTLIKRSVSTQMTMADGEVVALAGLADSKEEGTTRKLPFFGAIFGEHGKRETSEILIFLEAKKL